MLRLTEFAVLLLACWAVYYLGYADWSLALWGAAWHVPARLAGDRVAAAVCGRGGNE